MGRSSGGWWAGMLNAIADGSSTLPPVVQRLALGRISRWEPGYVLKEWPLDREMLNPAGVLFGGYYGALADQMLSFAAMSVLEDDEALRTTDMQLWYFRPISTGPVKVESRIVNRGRTLIHGEVTFTPPDGKLAARATGAMNVMRNDPHLAAAQDKG